MPRPLPLILVEPDPRTADRLRRELAGAAGSPDIRHLTDPGSLGPTIAEMAQCLVLCGPGLDRPVVAEILAEPAVLSGRVQAVFLSPQPGVGAAVSALQASAPSAASPEELRRYEGMVSCSGDYLALLDSDFVYRIVNANYVREFGFRSGDLVGKSPAEVFGPEFFANVIKPLGDRCLAGERVGYQDWFDLPVGGRKYLDVLYTPYRDASGRITGFVVAARDQTERKLAEDAVARTAREWTAAMDSFSEAVYLLSCDRRLLRANRTFFALTGLEPAAVIGRHVEDFIHPDCASAPCPVCRAQRDLRDLIMTMEADDPANPAGKPLEVDVRIVRDGEGEPSGILMILRDLTATRAVSREILDSRRRMELALEGADLGTWDWNIRDSSVAYNQRWAGMLGYDLGEIDPDVGSWERLVHPDDLPAVSAALGAHLAGKTASYETEHRVRHKDGHWVWVLDKGRVIERDPDGKPLRACGTHLDITERRRSEEEIRDREAYLRSVFRAAPVGIGVVRDRVFHQVNRRMCEMTGYSSAELIGRDSRLIYPSGEEYERVGRDKYQQIRLTGTGIIETRFLRKDGTVIDVLLSSSPLDLDDLDKGVTFTALDITTRKQAQETVARQERHHRMVLSGLHEDILIIDPEYTIVDVNREVSSITGRRREDLVGRPCYRALGGLDVPCAEAGFECRLQEVFAQGEACNFKHTMTTVAGEPRHVDILMSPLRDEDGRVTHVIEAVRDITELVAGQEQRQLLTSAIEQSSDTVLITDEQGRIQYANPALERTSGYSPQEVEGKNPRILKSGAHDEEFYAGMWRTISGGETWSGRIVNRRKDGRCYTEEATISPVKDSAGRILRYVAVKHDVSERIRLEEQFQQAQKVESIGRLAGGVAHDLNNLLSPILGYGEMLLDDLARDDVRRESVNHILYAGHRARDLVRQLLAFSRKQTLEPQPLDLNRVVENFGSLLRRTIREDIELDIQTPEASLMVMADLGQIEQVVMNLAVNAADAMPAGGRLTIWTDEVTDGAGDWARLSVRDTGVGMDEAVRSQVFDPFFSTKGEQGTGLGLATVHGIVTQHGGSIRVDSRPGDGACFTILLPRSQTVPQEGPEPAGLDRGRGAGETILLVEDSEQVRVLVQTMLERQGYRVVAAADGKEALAIVREAADQIDLLMSDVIMPDLNGQDLYERAALLKPGLKVLFMSGYIEDAVLSRNLKSRRGVFIQKPFTANALIAMVQDILGRGVSR